MKFSVQILFLLLFSGLLFSCKEEEPEPEKFFTYKKDGVIWSGEPNIFTNQDTLIIRGREIDPYLSLKVKFTGVGEYGPANFRITYKDVAGGDVFVSNYTLAEDLAAAFYITEYNPETKAIKGTFHFTARKTQGAANYKETLHFSQGAFKGTVLRRNWF